MKTTLNFIIIFLLVSKLQAQQNEQSILGTIDFYALLKAAPVLQETPEQAFQYACNKNINCQGDSPLKSQYEAFKKKADMYAKNLQSSISSKSQAYYDSKGSEGMYNDSKKQVNQNELIKQMGGLDNVMNMSEKDREIAAKKAMAHQAASSSFSPFTEAEMKRMMNDPEYAKQMAEKYNNMTENQKADLVKKKLATTDINVSNEEFESQMKQRQVATNTIDINLFISKTTTKMYKAGEIYASNMERLRKTPEDHNELDKSYELEYKKIPLIVMGEGKIPDPKMVRDLKLKYALKHKERAAIELSQTQVDYKNLVTEINGAINDYNAFLEKNGYRVNGKMKNIYNGTNTELSLAQLEMSIGESIGKIAEICYSENSIASAHEQHYQYVLTEK